MTPPFGLPARVESQIQRYVFLVSTFKRLQSALFAADCTTSHNRLKLHTSSDGSAGRAVVSLLLPA